MTIIGWTWWGDPQYNEIHPWKSSWEETEKRKMIVAKELRDKQYKFTGDYHQNGEFGVPIFDDGTLFMCSQREWGGIMAKAYPEEIDNSDGMGYVDWAWMPPEHKEMSVPSANDYEERELCDG